MKHRIKHHAIQRESDHRDEAQAEKTAKADEQGVDETERRLHADPPGSAEQSKREQKPVCYRVEHASIAMDRGLDATLRTQSCRVGVEALFHFRPFQSPESTSFNLNMAVLKASRLNRFQGWPMTSSALQSVD